MEAVMAPTNPFNNPHRWYSLAPNMVVYFFGLIVATMALEGLLSRFSSVYRDHLSLRQRRKFVSHAWLAIAAFIGLILQCVAYNGIFMPSLYKGSQISQENLQLLAGVSCMTIVVYMFDLAYTVADIAVICHHMATAVALVLVVFSIYSNYQIQLYSMFSTILLMFETLSGTTYIAMLLHRLWASPVAHPTLKPWAGRFMLEAAVWFIITRVFVYSFGLVRFGQMVRKHKSHVPGSATESPLNALAGDWYWVWTIYLPIMFVALFYAHYKTAMVMVQLGLRDLKKDEPKTETEKEAEAKAEAEDTFSEVVVVPSKAPTHVPGKTEFAQSESVIDVGTDKFAPSESVMAT